MTFDIIIKLVNRILPQVDMRADDKFIMEAEPNIPVQPG
jgi:hypothetical protein